MLDWLKTILGTAHTDEIDKKVSDEIGKNFVARTDFNTKNAELAAANATIKERDGQLDTIKKSTGDAAALKEEIIALQAKNAEMVKTQAAALHQLKIDNAVTIALAGAKAKNTIATKALLATFLEKAELADDGTVKGLAEQLKMLMTADDSSFLFETEAKPASLKGMKPAESSNKAPAGGVKTPKDMTYDELCTLLTQNPEASLE